MNSESFFPDGPMESRARIRRLYVVLAAGLGGLLIAMAGFQALVFQADARSVPHRLASIIAPACAAMVLAHLTLARLAGRSSAGQGLPAIVLFVLLVTGSVASTTAPTAFALLLFLLALSHATVAGTTRTSVATGLVFILLASAMLAVTRDAAATMFAVITGAGLLLFRVSAGRVLSEAGSNYRLLGQARSAASTLTDVILRVEQTVHRARIHEMTRERRRVAREIHDSVGYTLTGLIVQLGVVNRLVDSTEARNRLEKLESIARQALQEVRQEVGVLRTKVSEDKVPFLNRWVQVCDYFAECTGIRVDHTFDAALTHVPANIGETVYRVIQEGLTNAYRHGEATIVDVSMAWKPERGLILLRISDNGRGLDTIRPGNGLSGIRERIESMSGSLVIQSELGRGFDMGVDIPWSGPLMQVAGG